MADTFVIHDLYMPSRKKVLRSAVQPLNCYICKKELNGISITAKVIDGRPVFLCSTHLNSDMQKIISSG